MSVSLSSTRLDNSVLGTITYKQISKPKTKENPCALNGINSDLNDMESVVKKVLGINSEDMSFPVGALRLINTLRCICNSSARIRLDLSSRDVLDDFLELIEYLDIYNDQTNEQQYDLGDVSYGEHAVNLLVDKMQIYNTQRFFESSREFGDLTRYEM